MAVKTSSLWRLWSVVLCLGVIDNVHATDYCGLDLEATSLPQFVTSPNFPSNYRSNLDCLIDIHSQPGTVVELEFFTFDLEDSEDCSKDSLEVTDGRDGRLLLPSCSMPFIWPRYTNRIMSTLNSLTLTFTTDYYGSASGFNASYRATESHGDVIIVAAEDELLQLTRYNDVVRRITIPHILEPIAVDFDPRSQYIYYTDREAQHVARIQLSGTYEIDVIISENIEYPIGLRIDVQSRLLYITDADLGTVSVSDLDGNYRRALVNDLDKPGEIEVEPHTGYIYYTDWGHPPKIERADGDGSNRLVLVDDDISAPRALALDAEERALYWVDDILKTLQKVNYDGSDHYTIYHVPSYLNVFSMVLDAEAFFFIDADPEYGAVRSIDRGLAGEIVGTIFGGHRYYRGVTLRPLQEIASNASDTCPHTECVGLCLPRPAGLHLCVRGSSSADICPDDISAKYPEGQDPSTRVNWTEPANGRDDIEILEQSHSPGDLFMEGETTVTYKFINLTSSNHFTCSFTVTVREGDTEPPVFVNCPRPITMFIAPGGTSALIFWDPVTLVNQEDFISIISVESGNEFLLGTETVLIQAADLEGNTAWCNFTVTVTVDDIPPQITGCPSNISVRLTESGDRTKIVEWSEPTLTDNSGEAYWVTRPASPGSSFSVGSTDVTYVGRDLVGNTAMCSFYVRVEGEMNPPIFTSCPIPISVWVAPSVSSTRVTWDAATLDNEQDTVVWSSAESGNIFNVGVGTVAILASDQSGNEAWCNFTVSVTVDDIPPDLTHCPSNISSFVKTAGGQSMPVTWSQPSLTDNSGDSYWTNITSFPGARFPVGSTKVSYVGQDKVGNTASCSFYVIVVAMGGVDGNENEDGTNRDNQPITGQGSAGSNESLIILAIVGMFVLVIIFILLYVVINRHKIGRSNPSRDVHMSYPVDDAPFNSDPVGFANPLGAMGHASIGEDDNVRYSTASGGLPPYQEDENKLKSEPQARENKQRSEPFVVDSDRQNLYS